MNNVKSVAIKTKNHLNRHKFTYVASAVAITALAINAGNVKAFTSFLTEKGIDPAEYFNPEAFAELSA